MYEEQEDSMSSLKEIQALQLQSEKVFDYFEEICAIPHGSRNTKAISDYLVAFAKKHDLTWYQVALQMNQKFPKRRIKYTEDNCRMRHNRFLEKLE